MVEYMGMNNKYSSFNNNLLKQSRYSRIVEDADDPKVLYENIKKKYDGYVLEYDWNLKVYGEEIHNNGNWKDPGKYAFRKVKEAENKPNEADLSNKAVNVDVVKGWADKYSEMVTSISRISGELEALKKKIGAEKLYVDNKNYEIRIDDLINKIDKEYVKLMNEFTDAVKDRAQFVHDFQVCVQKDWIRYFGNESSYNRGIKWWNRKDEGWNI